MSDLLIKGYGDDLTINGLRIGDLTPHEHEKIEKVIYPSLMSLLA